MWHSPNVESSNDAGFDSTIPIVSVGSCFGHRIGEAFAPVEAHLQASVPDVDVDRLPDGVLDDEVCGLSSGAVSTAASTNLRTNTFTVPHSEATERGK